jgi:hypothetical protein
MGRELKIAAQKGLRVRYVEFHNGINAPYYDGVTVLEKAKAGYHIGPSNADLDLWDDDEPATGKFPEGYFLIYSVFGIEYK